MIRMAVFPESNRNQVSIKTSFWSCKRFSLPEPLSSALFFPFRDSTSVDAESRFSLAGTVKAAGMWKETCWQCQEASKVLNMKSVIMLLPPSAILKNSTADWNVFNAKQEEALRLILVISVTEKALGKLKEKPLKLFLGLEQMPVKV